MRKESARAPVTRGDSVVISSVADTNPISYPLAVIPNNVSYETVSEQPEVQPNQPLSVKLSFHGGLSYSHYNEQEATAFLNTGVLTHEPNIIRAPLAVGSVTLTGAANPPNYFFEAVVNDGGADDGQPVLYVIANEAAEINVYKISLDSGDFGTLLNTKTFAITPTQPCGKPAEWHDGSNTRWYLGLGDNGKIQRLDSIVSSTAADAWTASGDADARHLKVVGNRLVRSTNENQVSLLARGADPMAEANWGGDFFVGDASANITELGEASGLEYIAKEDGFWEWDLTGEAVNVFPEIGKSTRNGQGMVYWHGGFKIPAATGLWWTRTGKPIGPDSNPNNRASDPVIGQAQYLKHGRWMGQAAFGEYVCALYVDSTGASAYLLMGRERDDSDPPGWGPIIWHCLDIATADLDDFHGIRITETSEFGATDIRPCLWYPNGNNLRYIWLDKDGSPAGRRGDVDLDTGALVWSGLTDFGLPDVRKQLQSIEGRAEDFVAVGGSWRFAVARDTTNEENVGMTITADGFFTRYWTQDSNDTARVVAIKVTWVGNSGLTNSNGPHLRDVIIRAVALPDVTREWTFLFAVEDAQSKTSKKIRSEMEGYIGDLKKYTLPDGDTFNGVMGKPRLLRADEIDKLTPRNQEPPHYVIAATVREMS